MKNKEFDKKLHWKITIIMLILALISFKGAVIGALSYLVACKMSEY